MTTNGLRRLPLLVPLLFCGAMFGFFFAWQCSTVIGLNRVEPAVAIRAMQAMNASVRNMAFGTAFFGTPVVLAGFAIGMALLSERGRGALLALAFLVHLGGVIAVTATINVPLNQILALVDPLADAATAAQAWADYAGPWLSGNLLRTLASGLSLALVGIALLLPDRKSPR